MLPSLDAVETLLWEEWDPIGVRQIPNWPMDEYDAYAADVLIMLRRGASALEIAAYLADLETGHIGFSRQSGRAMHVAQMAVAMLGGALARPMDLGWGVGKLAHCVAGD